MKWTNNPIKILGIWCSCNPLETIDLNYHERIKKLKSLLNIWGQRNISLKGKITVLWSVALPLILYTCSILYTPQWVIKEVDMIFFKFLWSNKKHHVKKASIISNIEGGGLKMLDFESMVKANKISWIKRYNSNKQSKCAILATVLVNMHLPISDVIHLKRRKEYLDKFTVHFTSKSWNFGSKCSL